MSALHVSTHLWVVNSKWLPRILVFSNILTEMLCGLIETLSAQYRTILRAHNCNHFHLLSHRASLEIYQTRIFPSFPLRIPYFQCGNIDFPRFTGYWLFGFNRTRLLLFDWPKYFVTFQRNTIEPSHILNCVLILFNSIRKKEQILFSTPPAQYVESLSLCVIFFLEAHVIRKRIKLTYNWQLLILLSRSKKKIL